MLIKSSRSFAELKVRGTAVTFSGGLYVGAALPPAGWAASAVSRRREISSPAVVLASTGRHCPAGGKTPIAAAQALLRVQMVVIAEMS